MSEPKFGPVSLTEMMNAGVLANVNETRLWPLGLALMWDYDPKTGEAANLRIVEYRFPDGHHEAIEEAPDDPVMAERHDAYRRYVIARTDTMPRGEALDAMTLLPWEDDVPDGSLPIEPGSPGSPW
jgi:hypothetical protein